MLRRRTGKPEDLRALKILIQIYLEPMGGEGELTTFGDVYRAVGVNPADRQCRCRFRRALLELERDRQTEILLPLCVLLRDAEHNEFVQRLLVELGYLERGVSAKRIVTLFRDLWRQLSWTL